MIFPPLSPDSLTTALNEEKVLAALGSKLRWQMLRMLAGGNPMHAAEVAKAFGRDFDGISKHLRILRSAGVIQSRTAKDRRVIRYFVPAEFRRIPGEIDLGFCLLRVPEAKPDSEKKPVAVQEADIENDPIEEEPPMQGFGEMLVNSATFGQGREG